ncbi:MAG TPA: cobyrinate a,c-diamide synthase [Acidimicrobiales bacterium]|nr:cobyrinate a,c-diamide synthase [Acidimicrobiales bacterium]
MLPRLVVAGTHSGVGKTTVATGLMAALRRRGMEVAPAKVGPDFIDPGYHALATGRPGRNLDSWICGAEAVPWLAASAAAGADVLVVEGVMGLFDGSALPGPEASTAEVATLLSAPVVLVVDAAAMSGSVAALVHGFATWRPGLHLGGVVLNRVGSPSHEDMLRRALEPVGVPVLGALRRDPAMTWRDRHLGLVPVVEQPEAVRRSLDRLAAAVQAGIDLAEVVTLARSAPDLPVPAPPRLRAEGPPAARAVVAVAAGPAFSFCYPDNLEALAEEGAELVPFDPLVDAGLPAGAQGLVAGGGFPEVFGEALAANRPLLDDVARRVADGLVVWAECGGLLWLARSLDGRPLAGVVGAEGRMTDRLTMGYRRAVPTIDSPVAPAGAELRGHEFHYSEVDPAGSLLRLEGRAGSAGGGHGGDRLFASYLHLHLGADSRPAARFVASCADPVGPAGNLRAPASAASRCEPGAPVAGGQAAFPGPVSAPEGDGARTATAGGQTGGPRAWS